VTNPDTAITTDVEALVVEKSATLADFHADLDVGQIQWIEYETPASKSPVDLLFGTTGTLNGADYLVEPPEDPSDLYATYSKSCFLPAIVHAFRTNVYRTGYTLEPVIDLNQPDSRDKVRRLLAWQKAEGDFTSTPSVSDQEIDQALEAYTKRAELEAEFIREFIDAAPSGNSWTDHWDLTGQDLKVTGNAYWEVLRDTRGRVARFRFVPCTTVRAKQPDTAFTVTKTRIRHGLLGWKVEPQHLIFNGYVQKTGPAGQTLVHFKAFGDPRIFSRKTGIQYATLYELFLAEASGEQKRAVAAIIQATDQTPERRQAALNQILPLLDAHKATEILHLREPYGNSTIYGWAPWAGASPAIVGARELDEENLKIVKDEAIPQLLLLIAGGTIGQKSYNRIQDQLKSRKPGRKGILAIEAQPATKGMMNPIQPTIEAIKLKSEQNADQLFQNYDKRCEEKALGIFRMPRSQLGKDLGANRATNLATERFAQNQLYEPERQAHINTPMNDLIFPAIDVRCWKYKALALQPQDPELRAQIIGTLIDKGVLTVEEARKLAAPIFGETLATLEALWAKLTPKVLTVLLQTKNRELSQVLLGNDPKALLDLTTAAGTIVGLDPGTESSTEIEPAGAQV